MIIAKGNKLRAIGNYLTLNLLTTTIVAPPSNASKWQMGFNSAFKGLMWILGQDWGTRLRSWFRHQATSRRVVGSIPVGDHWLLLRGKCGRNVVVTSFPIACADCLEIPRLSNSRSPTRLYRDSNCDMIIYLNGAVTSLETDLRNSEGREHETRNDKCQVNTANSKVS